MKRYITDGLSMPIERSRRKDYQVFMPNNKREEMQFGKKTFVTAMDKNLLGIGQLHGKGADEI